MRTRASHDAAISRLTDRCRESGLKVTPQRIAVYAAVAASQAHPNPEEVFQTVRPGMPSLSLATVYKTLDCLEELGLVHRVAHDASVRRYDANLDPHHHLVCRRCGSIIDFTDAGLSRIRIPGNLEGFVPDEVSIQVRGTCEACLGDAEE